MNSIVVVGHRREDRELLAAPLDRAGHRVLQASEGKSALELVHATRPALVIAELLMPQMNGYEFTHRLRAEPLVGDTPVIFSAAGDIRKETRRLAHTCGVSHFVPKPADAETVTEAVRAALAGCEPHEQIGAEAFEREHLRVLNAKLLRSVEEVGALNADRRRLFVRLVQAHEQERQTIAAAIHDDPIQVVAAIAMRMDALASEVADEGQRATLRRLRAEISGAVDCLRRQVFELQPAAVAGTSLSDALRTYLDHARKSDRIEYELSDRMTAEPEEATRALLYRGAQEALANARKHARASRVTVDLEEREGEFLVRVSDDGRGFDPDEGVKARLGHLGLASIRERVELAGGHVALASRPGAGASVEIAVPAGATGAGQGR